MHSADKVGRDAGELCGVAPTGVLATGTIDDVIALAPDCVLYMPSSLDAAEVSRPPGVRVERRDDPR